MSVVNWADRNKHISYTNSGNASLSIWVEQHEEVHDAEGRPQSLNNMCICLLELTLKQGHSANTKMSQLSDMHVRDPWKLKLGRKWLHNIVLQN